MEKYIFLFADIVGYSNLPDAKQPQVVLALQQAVEDSPVGPRIMARQGKDVFMPTGDGMLVASCDEGLLRQPKAMLDFADALRTALAPEYQLRIGLHLGDAEQYTDFNAKYFYENKQTRNNVLGRGINFAQRVMSLADPGDILVSGSFHEHYSGKYTQEETDRRLKLLGNVLVKHGRGVVVYRYSDDAFAPLPKRIRDYQTAHDTIFALLQGLIRVAENIGRHANGPLHTRASLLLPRSNELYVSGFRAGKDVGPRPSDPMARSARVSFLPSEGPGLTFRDGRTRYFPLPSPTKERDYFEALEVADPNGPGIPAEKARQFSERRRAYLYCPVSYGLRGAERFGVISIDAKTPFGKHNPARFRNEFEDAALHLLRQFGYAWTILRGY